MTAAPHSASTDAAMGTNTWVATSRTRTPASGPSLESAAALSFVLGRAAIELEFPSPDSLGRDDRAGGGWPESAPTLAYVGRNAVSGPLTGLRVVELAGI